MDEPLAPDAFAALSQQARLGMMRAPAGAWPWQGLASRECSW